MSGVFFSCRPPYSLRQSLSVEPKTTRLTSLEKQLVWGSPASAFLAVELKAAALPAWLA